MWSRKLLTTCVDSKMECESYDAALKALTDHEVSTNCRYAAYKTSKDFGHTSLQSVKKVHWKDPVSVTAGRQEFSGVPFVILGQKVLDCQFGKDRKTKAKERKKNQKKEVDHSRYAKGHKFIVQDSKKIGCKARCILREIARFPCYQVSSEASYSERELKAEDLLVRLQSGEEIGHIRIIICIFPEFNEHTCHHELGQVTPEPIDPRVAKKIKDMCEAGVRDIEGMKMILKSYVKEICQPLPNPGNNRFYPSDKIISNHMYVANKGQPRDDQQSLIGLVHEWQKNDGDYVYCRLKSRETQNSVCTEGVEYGERFLFVYQSAQQKRLLRRYGTMIFLDATYKTSLYDLPLFFIAVRTNVGYQIVGTFICENEMADSIAEGLSFLKQSENWQPSYIMTDFQESEILAAENVFTDAHVLLCDVHRNRSWQRWTSKKENVRDNGTEVLKWLMRLGNAKDEEKFQSTLDEFKATPLWKENAKLQQYMGSIWLPQKKRWSKAYRTGLVEIVAATNNGIESQHKIFKAKFLHRKTTYGLSTMLKIMINDFFPSMYRTYVDKNLKYSGKYRLYVSEIPAAIHRRPRQFIKHCMLGMDMCKSIARSCIESVGDGMYLVKVEGSKYQVSIGNEVTMPNCTCDNWYKYQMPCQHILAAIHDGNEFHWERLSALYMQSVYCTIDDLKTEDVVVDSVQEIAIDDTSQRRTMMDSPENTMLDDPENDVDTSQKRTIIDDPENDADMEASLKMAQVQTREKLHALIALTYNITDERKLRETECKLNEIMIQYETVAHPPLMPLRKRLTKKKLNKRLSLSRRISKAGKQKEAKDNVVSEEVLWQELMEQGIAETSVSDTGLNTANTSMSRDFASLPEDFIPENYPQECDVVERIWQGEQMDLKWVGPYVITSGSIHCISDRLSDEVIDAFLYCLSAKMNVLHVNCVTMTAIFEGQVDIHHCMRAEPSLLNHETIVGAFNEGGGHWVLIVIHPKDRKIVYVNSLGALTSRTQDIVLKWFNFLKCRFDAGLETELPQTWKIHTPQHSRQIDSTSCGIYTLKFAENYLEGRVLTFTWSRVDVDKARHSLAVYLLSVAKSSRIIDDSEDVEILDNTDLPTKEVIKDVEILDNTDLPTKEVIKDVEILDNTDLPTKEVIEDVEILDNTDLPTKEVIEDVEILDNTDLPTKEVIKDVEILDNTDPPTKEVIEDVEVFENTDLPTKETATQDQEKQECRYSQRQRIQKKRSIGCEYTSYKRKKRENILYCLCRKEDDGNLYWYCEGCKNWYHPSCVGLTEIDEPENFFCPYCVGTDEDR